MERPYKILIVTMWFMYLKSAVVVRIENNRRFE